MTLIKKIKDLWNRDPGHLIWICLLLLLFIAALVSKFLISLSIMLMLPTIFFALKSKHGRLILKKKQVRSLLALTHWINPPYFWFIIFFVVTLFSAFYSDHTLQGLQKVQLRLPYLILPLVFLANKPLDRNEMYVYLGIVIRIAALICAGVLINYFLFFDQITESLSHGKSIPTPSNHIRFSLFISFLSLCGVYLAEKKRKDAALIVSVIFLIVSLHILAVRSGLVLFYVGLIYLITTIFYSRVRKRVLFLMVLAICSLPFLAYNLIPSLENRIDYMIYDLNRYRSGDLGAYSDGDRFRSIQMGWELFKDNIWFGCGVGDIEEKTEELYEKKYSDRVNVKLAHNQLVYFLATTGIVGTLLSLPVLILPYLQRTQELRQLIHLHGLILIISCTIEATIEGTNGIIFHLLFILLLMRHNQLKVHPVNPPAEY